MEKTALDMGEQGFLGDLDTGKGSLAHLLFTCPPPGEITFVRHHLIPFLLMGLIAYILPLGIAYLTLPSLLHPTDGITVPYLRDHSMAFMFLVALPLVVVFLLRERKTIPSCLANVIKPQELTPDNSLEKRLRIRWEAMYKKANLFGQGLGVVASMAIAWTERVTFMAPGTGFWGAATASGQGLSTPAWVLLCFQIPLITIAVSLYVVRGVTTTLLFREITSHSLVEVEPFHPDRSGGLRKIGRIGLRNQYLLMLFGLNFVAAFITYYKTLWLNPGFYYFWTFLGFIYLTCGPLVFLGPLMPFRPLMREARERERLRYTNSIKREYEKALGGCGEATEQSKSLSLVKGLLDIKPLLDRIPVWPFDHQTQRRFWGAYITPLATMLLTYAWGLILDVFKIGPPN